MDKLWYFCARLTAYSRIVKIDQNNLPPNNIVFNSEDKCFAKGKLNYSAVSFKFYIICLKDAIYKLIKNIWPKNPE